MWRHVAFIVPLVIASLAVTASPAWAPCVAVTIPDVVDSAEAVWWATVTDATPAAEGAVVDMTVRIDDVLKGPGEVGATAAVTRTGVSCGPFIMHLSNGAVRRLVGDQLLLAGGIDRSGHLDASSEINQPQGLTPEQQYHRALASLGLDDRDPPPNAPWRDEVTGFPWYGIPTLGVVVLGVLIAVFVAWKRKRDSSELT